MEYKEYIPQSVAEQTSPPALMVGYYPAAYIPSVPARTLPHMVTIKELAAECQEKGIAITEHFIRRLCLENKICYVKAGSKYLVNYERFIDYLNGETAQEDNNQKQGTIRPIPVKL